MNEVSKRFSLDSRSTTIKIQKVKPSFSRGKSKAGLLINNFLSSLLPEEGTIEIDNRRYFAYNTEELARTMEEKTLLQSMISAGYDIIAIVQIILDAKAAGVVNTDHLLEKSIEIGNKVIEAASSHLPEGERIQEFNRAMLQSALRWQSYREEIQQMSGHPDPESLQVEQLKAIHVKEMNELKLSHTVELARVRAEAEEWCAEQIEAKKADMMADIEKSAAQMKTIIELEQLEQSVALHNDESVESDNILDSIEDDSLEPCVDESEEAEKRNKPKTDKTTEKTKELESSHAAELQRLREKHVAEMEKLKSEMTTKATVSTRADSLRHRDIESGSERAAVPTINEDGDQSEENVSEAAIAAAPEERVRITIERTIQIIDSSIAGDLLAFTNLPIIRLMEDLLDSAINDHDMSKLDDLASHFSVALSQLPQLNKLVGSHLRLRATKMENEVCLTRMGFGSILKAYEVSAKSNEDHYDVFAVKCALFRAANGYIDDDAIKEMIRRSRYDDGIDVSSEDIDNEVTDEDVRSFINNAVKNSRVERHISIRNMTRNLLTHVLHCRLVHYLLSRISILDVFQGLTKRDKRMNEAREFALRANPDCTFHKNMSTMDFLLKFVSPGLENDDFDLVGKAWEIACNMFDCLSKIVSVGNKAAANAKENDARKSQMIALLRSAECQTISGETDENADVYWSEHGKVGGERRLRILRTFACILLKPRIRMSIPSALFAEYGFTRTILRLSPSSIGKCCTFITPNFLLQCRNDTAVPRKYMEKFDKEIKVERMRDSGEQTIFVQSDEQRNSLKVLLRAYQGLVK